MTTNKPTRAEARRLAASYAQAKAAPAPLAPALGHLLSGYVPENMGPATWAAVQPHHADIMNRSMLRGETSFRKHRRVVADYLAFRVAEGLAPQADESMSYTAIDHYYMHGMASYDPKTRNDYRSRLRALAAKVNPGLSAPGSVKIGRVATKPPYTAGEEAAIGRYAMRQRSTVTGRQLCAAVALCAGAGGDSVDLRQLRRRDIAYSEDAGYEVHFSGPRARTVTLRRAYEDMLLTGIAGLSPGQLVIGRDLKRRNIVGGIVERADLEGCPHIEASRLRATWLAWVMCQPLPLNAVLQASGLKTAHTLCDLLPYLPEAGSPALLRGGAEK
ncbi:MAG: hypothetical protein M0013_07865 [Actinomycetota bacterium]|nr:hypothetical protein [Actinomycetota bacterium]